MGPLFFVRTILFAAALAVFASGKLVLAQPLAEGQPYYIEFRVAENGPYGHSYIAYGRLGATGRPISAAYADIHPTGHFTEMVLGHFLLMEAETRPDRDSLGRKLASRFRRTLTAAEYHRLTAVIARVRAADHNWNILIYNCNDFVADVARGIGMRVPTTLSLPYDFIPMLQAMNPARHAALAQPTAPARLHRTAPVRG